ncbi:hypothetical protein VTN02DRAFT_77 [Thermoascus thermophilus]
MHYAVYPAEACVLDLPGPATADSPSIFGQRTCSRTTPPQGTTTPATLDPLHMKRSRNSPEIGPDDTKDNSPYCPPGLPSPLSSDMICEKPHIVPSFPCFCGYTALAKRVLLVILRESIQLPCPGNTRT